LFLAIPLPWQVFRLAYYGAWLPNTFYAKVDADRWLSMERGLRYLREAGQTGPVVVLALLAFLFLLGRVARRFEVILPAGMSLVYITYVLWVGGDYMGHYRFLVPLLAPLALAFAVALQELEPRLPERARGQVVLSLGAVPVLAGFLPYWVPPRILEFKNSTERFVPAAEWIAEKKLNDLLVATPAVGAIAYLGRVRVLDEFGLTNAYIARHLDPDVPKEHLQRLAGHSRGNAAYVLSANPDLVLLGNVWVYKKPLTPERLLKHRELLSITDERLLADEQFYQRYDLFNFPLSEARWLGLAVRKGSPLHPDNANFRGPLPLERLPQR
jgi:hypothetical protein